MRYYVFLSLAGIALIMDVFLVGLSLLHPEVRLRFGEVAPVLSASRDAPEAAIASLRARAEEIRAAELAKAEPRLERLTEGERRTVESVTAQIVNKLLHLPTVRMKQAAAAADGVLYADAVRHLFGLGEDDR